MSASGASSWTLRRLLEPLLGHPRASQVIKWTVYLSLTANFGVYLLDDWTAFRSALPEDAPLAEILETFSTTIDTVAWLGLVFLFELETYQLPDEKWKKWVPFAFLFTRFICYVSIAYAAYGYTASAFDYYDAQPEPGLTNLCQIAGEGRYYQQDVLRYAEITQESCNSLSAATTYYRVPEETSVMDRDVMLHNRFLGWIDIINAFVWIIVVFLIEIEVWLQSADRFSSRLLPSVRVIKTAMYAILIGNAGIWIATGYPIYAWDAFLWIFGFWAIELNLAEWERDRTEELATLTAA